MAANLKSMTDKSHQNSSATPADSFFFLALFALIEELQITLRHNFIVRLFAITAI